MKLFVDADGDDNILGRTGSVPMIDMGAYERAGRVIYRTGRRVRCG